ncbi:hypothetical protein THAOC_05724, partial [Thalassiosira oceanica]
STVQAFNHFPHHHDKEAYDDAIAPSPSECHQLTAFSDACWGGQFGNAVKDGTLAWKAVRQKRTALSSCEAEIVATNECVEELLSVCYRAADLDLLEEVSGPTAVYNDNQACVNWSASLTTFRALRLLVP